MWVTGVPDKVMEEVILSDAFTWGRQDNQGIKYSQYEFMKARSCLTNLISLYEEVMHLVDRERLWMQSV